CHTNLPEAPWFPKGRHWAHSENARRDRPILDECRDSPAGRSEVESYYMTPLVSDLDVTAGQPAVGFAALEEVPAGRIADYQPYWAAGGHLLQMLNRKDEAQQAFARAASLTDDSAAREFLFERSAGKI